MDRLSWYVAGESMEEILIQSGHVSIYEGDSKHVRVFFLLLFFSKIEEFF